MSLLRRFRRQAQRNRHNGLIRNEGMTGQRKKRARQFLKARDKRQANAAPRVLSTPRVDSNRSGAHDDVE